MATPGPAPISLEERRLRGNPGKRKPKPRPHFPVEAPPLPEWLSPAAAAEWERIVPTLLTRRLLAVTDYGVLAHYCASVATADAALRELQTAGVVIEGAKGDRKHPAFQVWRDSVSQLIVLARELGLTPSARSRMSAPEANPDDGSAGILDP